MSGVEVAGDLIGRAVNATSSAARVVYETTTEGSGKVVTAIKRTVRRSTALRRSYDEQQSCRPSKQQPASESSQPMTGMARAATIRRLAPIAIVAGTVLLALLVAVEKKPWWEMTWQFLTSGLQEPSCYAVNWPMLIVIMCVGLRLAWMVRQKLPKR